MVLAKRYRGCGWWCGAGGGAVRDAGDVVILKVVPMVRVVLVNGSDAE